MKMELVQAIHDSIQNTIDAVHTALPGLIMEIDYDEGTASVQPYGMCKTPTGKKVMYPMVYNVPIVVPQSSVDDACVAYPIKPGDTCLLIIAEGTLDYWLYDRVTELDTKFSLTNTVCIPGLTRRFNACFKEAAEDGAVILKYGDGKFKLTNTDMTISAKNLHLEAVETLTLSGATVNVAGTGNVAISGSRVDIN